MAFFISTPKCMPVSVPYIYNCISVAYMFLIDEKVLLCLLIRKNVNVAVALKFEIAKVSIVVR
jgi:hypothetical protein